MADAPSFLDAETMPEAALVNRARAKARMQATPEIQWADSEGPHSVKLAGGPKTLGSAATVDLVIRDAQVSRLHAEVEVRPDGVWVKDLGSRNGTFIRDVRVQHAKWPEEAPLRVGSTLLALNTRTEPTPVPLWPNERFGPLLGRTDVMRELFGVLQRVATVGDAPVLIQGETGTGKELVARAIHESSERAQQAFVVIDCASLSESLVESELFGHVQGAFTGAQRSRVGAFEQGDGGTVFLDEVGELPLSMQPKLLRVLETRKVRAVGDGRERPINVRILSATHRDLRTLVNAGAFREDLYFRLSALPVYLPPLRERRADVPLLLQHFIPPEAVSPFSEADLEELAGRAWLGNVRELRNYVDRALALGTARASAAPAPAPPQNRADIAKMLELPFKDAREAWNSLLEKTYVERLLAEHQHNVSAAARAAGVDRTYLYRIMQRHGL